MKKLVLVILTALLTVGGGWAIGRIRIKEISCVSQFGPCSAGIVELTEKQENNFWWRAVREIKQNLAMDKRVEEYEINPKFPNGLKVIVLERKAEAAVKAAGDEKYSLWSGDGVVLGEASETQLPTVFITDEDVEVEEKMFTAELMHELFLWKNIRRGEVRDGGLRVRQEDGLEIIFPLEGDLDVVLGRANLILSWLNSEDAGTRITIVDLRYRNPVIK